MAVIQSKGKFQEVRKIYDVLGFGLGPANLALLTTIQEEGEAVHGREISRLCIERQQGFCWHPGMLLDGAHIQLSFLKDLVTLRNPKSHFTFLNYLHHKGRLDRFANLRHFFPTRVEFNDYYRWAVEQVSDHVRFGAEVVEIAPVMEDGGKRVEMVKVVVRDVESGEEEEYLTRNLVVATGGTPFMPRGVDYHYSERTIHSNQFLHRIQRDYPDVDRPYRFVIVGSGQSAAEIFQYLYSKYPNADVTSTMRRFAYQPADESHFVNEIFFPEMEDFLFNLPEEKRQYIMKAHRDTNYSAVDRELIEEIYRFLYQCELEGECRARIRHFLELKGVRDEGDEVVLEFRNFIDDKTEVLRADAAIMATGYIRPKRHPLIDNLSSYLVSDGADGYEVGRYYRIQTRDDFLPQLFLQGFSEDTHGLSDTLLSCLPIRSYHILQSLALEAEGQPIGQKVEEVAI